MIRAVIFDFGGVVVNESFQDWISEFVAPYDSIKHEMLDLQDKVDLGDLPVSAYNEFLSVKTGKDPDFIEGDILSKFYLHGDVIALIKKLREQHIKTAIVSNFPDKWFTYLQEKFDFNHLFDEIFVSSRLHMIKPQKEFFHYVLEKLAIKPQEAVFTDDKKKYTDGAEQVGIHGVVFTSAEELKRHLLTFGVQV